MDETGPDGPEASNDEKRLCPVCLAPLTRERCRGEWIDGCTEHGLWLDHGELERIIDRRQVSLRAEQKRKLREAKRSGKFSGALFGWASLFWD